MGRNTKKEVIDEISQLIGTALPPLSTGSTESRMIFLIVNRELGLGIDNAHTKPEYAREIVERAGIVWTPNCESRGSTVTLVGLERVLAAVKFFVSKN
jgi:hypothetical protein